MKSKHSNLEANTRAKIINRAFDLFASKGIKDISMREIAEAAGVTKPVIYYYFEDKDELCFEIISEFHEADSSRMSALWRESAGLGPLLEKLFALYADNPKNKKMVGFMLHMHSYLSSHPQTEARLKKLHCCKKNILEDILAAEVSAGRIKEGMLFIAQHLIIAAIKHMILSAAGPGVKFPRSYPKDITAAVLRAIEYKGEKGK